MTGRPINFAESLAMQIEAGGYTRNRRPICENVGVSNAAISQYLGNRSKPSFDVLTGLAEFFGISLDTLVYGVAVVDERPQDLAPIVRYVDSAVQRAQERVSQQSALLARLADRLIETLREESENWLEDRTPVLAGLLRDDETLRVERFALRTRLISFTLHYDVIASESGPAAGRFFDVVVDNLWRGRSYEFLLPGGEPGHWAPTVDQFRGMISQRIGGDFLRNCSFREAPQAPFFAGVGIYLLDVPAFSQAEPVLFEQLRTKISSDGWMGYSIPPTEELQADAIFDDYHRDNALEVFDRLWRKASKL